MQRGEIADSLEAVCCREDPAGADDAAPADVLLPVLQADLPRPSLDGGRAPAQHARGPDALPAVLCQAAEQRQRHALAAAMGRERAPALPSSILRVSRDEGSHTSQGEEHGPGASPPSP